MFARIGLLVFSKGRARAATTRISTAAAPMRIHIFFVSLTYFLGAAFFSSDLEAFVCLFSTVFFVLSSSSTVEATSSATSSAASSRVSSSFTSSVTCSAVSWTFSSRSPAASFAVSTTSSTVSAAFSVRSPMFSSVSFSFAIKCILSGAFRTKQQSGAAIVRIVCLPQRILNLSPGIVVLENLGIGQAVLCGVVLCSDYTHTESKARTVYCKSK